MPWKSRTAAAAALAVAALAVVPNAAPVRAAAQSACDIDGVERIVAVGDVHGAADRLAAILTTAGLIDDRQKWVGGRAHLVQLGDLLDRGPDSRKAVDMLRRLQKEAPKAGGRVHLLLGNHEVMRILGDLRYATPGEYEAFATRDSEELKQRWVERQPEEERAQRAASTPLGMIEMVLAFAHTGEYGRWVRTLDTVAKINDVLFLHGGLGPAVGSLTCEEINATVRRELTTDYEQTAAAPLSSLTAREDGPLWYRGLATGPESFATEVDAILNHHGARAMVIGHTVTTSGRIVERFGGRVLQLDTGMQPAYVANGRASALEIRGGAVTAIYDDRREPLTGISERLADGPAQPAR